MVPTMNLADEKYLALTTYRKNGNAVTTPVWIVPLDGNTMGFWTSSASGKAKRLAHTAKVTLQPCDARGRVKPDTSVTTGTATLVTGAELATIGMKVKAKYGFMTKLTKLFNFIGHIGKGPFPYGDRGVVITPD
jgi:uncharacterized protein